ncbi:MAG: hypothetical protein H0U74_21195 [Bradymonadaceae bacterium]|nr:hypothetical protein [Lujinxingiaceae bacterium]
MNRFARSAEAPRGVAGQRGASGAPRRYTLRLDAENCAQDQIGGKAQGLRRLIKEGFWVPQAFCVTTAAFDSVTASVIAAAPDLEALQAAIRSIEFPPAMVEEIEAQMRFLGARSWAVRSSALEEDQSSYSFAGQQISVLGVSGLEAVLDAIRQVWASLYSLESLLYRAQLELNVVPRAMAVVIQQMVHPAMGGVMFTVNPLSGDRQEVVISSAAGSAETVVGGGASNTYYIEKSSGYARHHIAGVDGQGGTLSPIQLAELARAARRVETLFGAPQDVEWVYEAQPAQSLRLVFLQSRPITTDATESRAPSVWTNANVGEALPGVATPLTWSIIHNFSRKGFEQAFATLGLSVPEEYELVRGFRGRVYLNLTQFMSVASGIPVLKPETLFSMAGGGGVELVRNRYEKRAETRFWLNLPTTLPKIAAAQISMPLLAPLWGKYFTQKCEEFFDRDLSRVSLARLKDELELVDSLFDRTGLVMLTTSSNFLMSYVATRELLRWWGGPDAAQRERELFGGMQVKSAEPGLALLELGRLLRRSRRLRRLITETAPAKIHETLVEHSEHLDVAQFLADLDEFRRRYGHRAPREAELATPRWREETTFLFEVLKSFVNAPRLASSLEVERDRVRAREVSNEIIAASFLPGFKQAFEVVLKLTRSNARLREYMRDRVVDALDMYRRFFLACGHHLTESAQLHAPTDVFFLTYDEIRAWLDDPAQAEAFALNVVVRKALHEAFRNQPDPPDTFLLRGSEMVAEEEIGVRIQTGAEGGEGVYLELRGLPGSAGRVTGRARVIHDPNNEDATILPGEILVAPYTDVGWTPLFLTASAVVMSLGGPLSHSCIVAREYGIPTVVNAKRATEIIRTGDLVTVDGDRGVVYVRQNSAPTADER